MRLAAPRRTGTVGARAGELAVAHCLPEHFGDAAWPIRAQRRGLRVAYWAVDGLEWETPDHFRERAADDGACRWHAQETDARLDRWRARVRTALDIVQEALAAVAQPLW